MRWPIGVCIGLLLVCSAEADRIDDLVTAEVKRSHIPGVSVAVLRHTYQNIREPLHYG